MRPLDVSATPRNRHRVRAARILVFLANLLLVTSVVTGGYWLVNRVREDERFAIRSVEISGIGEPRTAEVLEVLDRWAGANLFRLEMDSVRHDLVSIDWVGDVAVEKMLPDRIRVEVVERVPKALIEIDGSLRYIDGEGVPFGAPDPAAERHFPTIENARGRLARNCVAFLEKLERSDPALHSRVDRIRPAGSFGWEIDDRDLGAVIRVDDRNVVRKWRTLYGIVRADRIENSSIRYADLRFDDQIVIGHDGMIVQE